MSPAPGKSAQLSPLGAWLFASAFWIAGGLIIALAMDWIHSPPENFHAPRWVVGAAGLMFVAGGFVPMIVRAGNDSWASRTISLIMIGALASVFNWIAFGPGPRQFSGGISVGAIGTGASVSETSGRIAFGIAAVLVDLMVAWALLRSVRRRRDEQE